ncbi:MAG: DUF2723 domain-containing protein [Chitinophagales bacterium]|nr:DUF2723 domain-containing protein [Chitinophagales bacterium]
MNQKTYNWINIISGWVVFAIAFAVYASTAESTASLWDCGEFISGAFKLQVVHPPGAPLFLIVNRIFALFASDPSQVAYAINISSAMFTAFSILFLYWIITSIAKKILTQNGESLSIDRVVAIQGSAWVGALACTFSDTIWFSAVEGEVYAMSTFFIAIVLWAVVRWENSEDDKYSNRWLVLAAYLVGLSIGVHLLSLLVIPIAVLIYYFKKYKPSIKGFIIAFFVGFIFLGIVQVGIIQMLTLLASKIELLFVNNFGLPFNSGVLFTYLVFISFLIAGIYLSHKYRHSTLQMTFVSLFMIMVSFSSYLMVPIRAAAHTPIDMNAPKDIFSLMSYLNREQYGDRPLLNGPLYNSSPIAFEKEGEYYGLDTASHSYIVKGIKNTPKYRQEDKVLFPRMAPTNDGEAAEKMYQYWANFYGDPTFSDNLAYFFNYQFGYMYWRYFMWNFSGRQDDYQGTFENQKVNGDWISGIPFIDDARLGSQSNLPPQIEHQKARNKYYLLPFLFGLFGLAFMVQKNKKDAVVFGLLFLITGLFLVIYFNSPPREPRERDYVYVGSFMTFCIWIGLSIAAAYDGLKQIKLPKIILSIGLTLVGLALVPFIMAKENYNDHNRNGRYMARDFANNYLESCPSNSILITSGDNDTYPLWYAQEVDGIRNDVRVMNTSLLQIDWYINGMKRKANTSEPLPFLDAFTPNTYLGDSRIYTLVNTQSQIIKDNEFADIRKIMRFVTSDNPSAKVTVQSGERVNYFPTKKMFLPVDKAAVLKAGIIPAGMEDLVVDTIYWELPRDVIMKDELALLMIIASGDWSRPICFANTTPASKYMGLDKYMIQEGMMYRFLPIRFEENIRGNIAVNDSKFIDVVENKFKYGNLDKHEMFVDENSARMMNLSKMTHLKLAEDLTMKGKKEEALKILNIIQDKFAYNNAPYYSPYNSFFNYYNIRWIDLYYRNGDTAKAESIYSLYIKDLADCYQFYKLPNEFARRFQGEYETAKEFVHTLDQFADIYKDDKLKKLLKEKFPELVVAQEQAALPIEFEGLKK